MAELGPAYAVSPLAAYVLRSVSGSAVVLTGFFLGSDGKQIGGKQSFSITGAITLTSLYNGTAANTGTTPLPDSLFGFEGEILTGNLWYGMGGNADGTFSTSVPDVTPQAGYPQIAAGNPILMGKVR